MAAGFGLVGAAFTANVFISGTDANLPGIATKAAQIIDENLVVTPAANWYFMIFSTLVLTAVGALVTERIIESRLGQYQGGPGERELEEITEDENRGLRNAVIFGLG